MVTFICYYCDATLKKKQLDSHQYRCQQPCSFTCVDCKKTFVGGEHKAHTECMTEKQKYYGQYQNGVPGKKQQTNNHQQQQQQQKQKQEEEAKKQKEEEEKQQKQQEEQEQQEEVSEFLGWKKEIRKMLKGQEKVKLKKVKKNIVKAFLQANPQWKEKDAELQFDQKIANKKYQLLEGGKYIAFATKN